MNNDEFKGLLKEAGLTKKKFAELLGTSSEVVNNWNTKNREIPYWVKSWLKLWVCCNNGIKLRNLLKDNICDKAHQDFAKIALPIMEDS